MAYTTINKSTDYFNTKLYTGTGSTQSITGVGFQPDYTVIKQRSGTEWHENFDVVRGTNKQIYWNETNAEGTDSNKVTSFDSDGFSLGTANGVNQSSATYVSWNWKAGGTASSNSDGSITSTVSVNQTAGFSIVSYTGNATSGGTVGHGLGAVPKVIMVKRRDTTGRWQVYHFGTSASPQDKYLFLDGNEAQQDGTNRWNDTAPTSSVFSLGNSTEVNASGGTYVAYCFAEKTGYSKFGVYTGNNSTNGTFIYTGFKPTWGLFKNKSIAGNWILYDVKRDPHNVMNTRLFPDTSNADDTGNNIDFLSNGFKHRTTGSGTNGSHNYVYLAFGQSLVGSNNVPCTAR
jgi:hypothetical protein